jgi:hypothetical protein
LTSKKEKKKSKIALEFEVMNIDEVQFDKINKASIAFAAKNLVKLG